MIKENLISDVIRYDRSQFTTSLKGEHTNWRIAKYKLYFFNDLMIKYPDEFMNSISNLIKDKGILYVLMNEPRLFFNYYYLELRKKLGKLKKNFG